MTIQGTHDLARPPAQVFEALNDPAILQQTIPGCEKLEKTAADEYSAQLKIGNGPRKAVSVAALPRT